MAIGPVRPHRLRQRPRAAIQRDPVGSTSSITAPAGRQQRDALAQGRLEGDLAAHGPLGDRGDRSRARRSGKFVDAFLADQRRIHVGDQQALAALRAAGR